MNANTPFVPFPSRVLDPQRSEVKKEENFETQELVTTSSPEKSQVQWVKKKEEPMIKKA